MVGSPISDVIQSFPRTLNLLNTIYDAISLHLGYRSLKFMQKSEGPQPGALIKRKGNVRGRDFCPILLNTGYHAQLPLDLESENIVNKKLSSQHLLVRILLTVHHLM